MTVTCRRYKLLQDFETVSEFLQNNYNAADLNEQLMQPFWEYAHTHPHFDHKLTHRMGLWEADGTLIGIACYELTLGVAFFSVKRGFEHLKPEMLQWAERELSFVGDGRHRLGIWVTDAQTDDSKFLEGNGYKAIQRRPVNIFPYDKVFVDAKLPEGFTIISLEDENDFKKINACLWKGFDNGPEPDDDIDCRMLMQSGPHFRKDLTTVIKAPNGDYACFAGMWLDGKNACAYLEPLATVPEYRRMGLATCALAEGIRKTKAFGATYMLGCEREFYNAIGFETTMHRELLEKVW
jgi:GNAT superfamily N-acetyltransferase